MLLEVPKNTNNLTRRRFGRLVVLGIIERRPMSGGTRLMWLCRCDCGGETRCTAYTLKSGHSKSCGCYHADETRRRSITHGMTKNRSRPPEYTIWHHAKRRCFVPSTPHFEDYGGRGITMCERWQKSFEAFYVDMGPRPTPKHSLERENTNGNYEPGNCRWATRIE